MTGLSRQKMADDLGVSKAAVQKAIRSGRIRAAVLADNTIDPDVARRLWRRNTDQTKPRNAVSGDPRAARDPAAPPQPARSRPAPGLAGNGMSDTGDAVGSGYTRWRGIRESYAAGLERLAYQEKIGSLVKATDVRRVAFEAYRMMMSRIEGWAHGLDEQLAATPDPAARRELWRTEIRKLREDLSRQAQAKADEARAASEPEPADAIAERA